MNMEKHTSVPQLDTYTLLQQESLSELTQTCALNLCVEFNSLSHRSLLSCVNYFSVIKAAPSLDPTLASFSFSSLP